MGLKTGGPVSVHTLHCTHVKSNNIQDFFLSEIIKAWKYSIKTKEKLMTSVKPNRGTYMGSISILKKKKKLKQFLHPF